MGRRTARISIEPTSPRARVEEHLAVEAGSGQRVGPDRSARRVDDLRVDEVHRAVESRTPNRFLICSALSDVTAVWRSERPDAVERASIGQDGDRRSALPLHDRGGLPAADEGVQQAAAIEPALAVPERQLDDDIRVDDVAGVEQRPAFVELRTRVVEKRLDAGLAVPTASARVSLHV